MSLLTSNFLQSGIYLMHNRKKEARRKATNESEQGQVKVNLQKRLSLKSGEA